MTFSTFLGIENLTVKVGDNVILKKFFLNINKGEVHVLLGPNGAGKTTLIKTILGFRRCKVLEGKIIFKDIDITDLPPNERVKLGIGVLFQRPPEINGVKLSKLLNVCGHTQNSIENGGKTVQYDLQCSDDLNPDLQELANRLHFSQQYLNRDVNVGFSGGEVKRSEILQMMALKPDLLLFDEPDSGVDVENVELIAKIMRELLDRDKIPSLQEKSGLIITHLGYILKFLGHITRAHILFDGAISCSGDPTRIIASVMKNGFEGCRQCLSCLDNVNIEPNPDGSVNIDFGL